MSAPSEPRQIEILLKLQRLATEGAGAAKKSSTYKFARLLALANLAVERGDDSGAPLTLSSIAATTLSSLLPFRFNTTPWCEERMRKQPFHVTMTATLWLAQMAPLSAHGQDAEQLYEQTCAMCHGAGGKGDGPTSQSLQPKPADLTVVVKNKSEAYLTKLITEGGPSVGKSPLMPSYKGILNEKQVESVVQYVKGLAR